MIFEALDARTVTDYQTKIFWLSYVIDEQSFFFPHEEIFI